MEVERKRERNECRKTCTPEKKPIIKLFLNT